jgi:hypothetical protein
MRRHLGDRHPLTLSCMVNMANCHGDSGGPESAEALERPAIALLQETLGIHHPDTLVCEANLAISLRQEGQVQDAEELRARVLADFTRVLGASHPDLAQLHKWQRINRDLEPQQI